MELKNNFLSRTQHKCVYDEIIFPKKVIALLLQRTSIILLKVTIPNV